MASISKDARGNRTIQFIAADKRRRSIRLGKVSNEAALKIKGHIEALNNANIMRQSVDQHTASWVSSLDDRMAGKLADVGLIQPRIPATPSPVATLGPFLDAYCAKRIDVKGATQEVWSQTVRNLKEHFGVERDIASINEGHCDDFKLFLIAEPLAPTTVSKRLQFARMFFRVARKQKLITENPFAEVSAKAVIRKERQHYVSPADTEALLAVCNPIWRTIAGLARYGGLRCPSEVLSLPWANVDWAASRIVVEAPKTEHHVGKATRTIPIFAKLRPILEEAWELAPAGAQYVVAGNYRKAALTPSGWRNCNLRTHFERIVKRAGLKPWPRLFHALRSSCETDLAAEFPLHVVTAWCGNSPKIAMKHYLVVTEADVQRAAYSGAVSPCTEPHQAEDAAAPDEDSSRFAASCDSVHQGAQALNGEDRIRTCGRE